VHIVIGSVLKKGPSYQANGPIRSALEAANTGQSGSQNENKELPFARQSLAENR
jgi:hypothetical protein